jgi:hypothetical protein
LTRASNLGDAVEWALGSLRFGNEVDTGSWQGISTEGKPDLTTVEVLNLQLEVPLMRSSWLESEEEWADELAKEAGCNQAWADEQFEERVGGIPRNPDPSHVRWPWWQGQYQHTASQLAGLEAYAPGADALTTPPPGFQFTHTYSERFWPNNVGEDPVGKHRGIRFEYGDYNDVLELLHREPYTRQAYLPIFFPEDTGAVHGGRIPCSLGYHLLLRGVQLHCWYEIRSCDAIRHFRDDLYLAARLVGRSIYTLLDKELWSDVDQVWFDVNPGNLYFTAHSFHIHKGDMHRVAPQS